MGRRKRKRIRDLLKQAQHRRCCYCGVRLTRPPRKSGLSPSTAMTIEHLRRICEGGTDDLDNLALACQRCNHQRGGVDWLTYTSYRRGELTAA